MKYKRAILFILVLFVASPFLVFAQLPNVGPTSWGGLAASVTNFLLNLVIPAAVVVIVWSGIQFMIGSGNEDRITQAKTTFTWAIIGLTVALIGKGLIVLIRDVLGG